MIRVVFFDVGETLIHGGRPFPGVVEALTAIAGLPTADGSPLVLAIISDYFMPEPPRTEAKIAALEKRYRDEVLNPTGLSRFFEPFDSRVTLSTRAGVFKPDRKIFEAALSRSSTGAEPGDCLFVTEDVEHLTRVADLGMTPVRFGPAGEPSGMAAFQEWVDAPAVIAALITPGPPAGRAMAIAPALDRRFGLVGFTPTGGDGLTLKGQACRLVRLDDARLGPLSGVFVEVPAEVTVELTPDGRAKDATSTPPGRDEMDDAVSFVSSLLKSGKVAVPGQPAPPFGTTHAVEMDSAGRRRLVRRKFSTR